MDVVFVELTSVMRESHVVDIVTMNVMIEGFFY